MRTTTLSLSAIALALFLVGGCEIGGGPRVQGIGPVVSATRTVGTFTGVELRSDADVVVAQGDTPGVKVEAQQNILDVLKTDVHGETLRIEYDHVNVGGHEPIKIYITTPTLQSIDLSGSGSITSDATWKSETFHADISGSGNLDARVSTAADLRATISGSGGLKLSGDAANCTLNISGSGHVRAFDLSAQDVSVSISGSGSADVNAARGLSANISGSGSVHYRGTPAVKSHISGAGSIDPAR